MEFNGNLSTCVAAKLAGKFDREPMELAQVFPSGRAIGLASEKPGEAFVELPILWERKCRLPQGGLLQVLLVVLNCPKISWDVKPTVRVLLKNFPES